MPHAPETRFNRLSRQTRDKIWCTQSTRIDAHVASRANDDDNNYDSAEQFELFALEDVLGATEAVRLCWPLCCWAGRKRYAQRKIALRTRTQTRVSAQSSRVCAD